jgi:Transposase, Mutator family
MTATPSIDYGLDPAQFLHEHLAQASPDLMRELLTTFVNALLSADADAVCGAAYSTRSPERVNSRNGYRHRDQAVGLIPAEVALVDSRGRVIDSKPFIADVRGSASSVYGSFGIAVGLITLVLLAGALWRLIRGPMFRNRWRRAIALAAPGLGLGFTLTFTMSVLRWATPVGSLWASFLLFGAAAGFVAGYLSPTPVEEDATEVAEAEPEDGWSMVTDAPAETEEADAAADLEAGGPEQRTQPVSQQATDGPRIDRSTP